jgi:hypothetical protein
MIYWWSGDALFRPDGAWAGVARYTKDGWASNEQGEGWFGRDSIGFWLHGDWWRPVRAHVI